MRQGHLKSVTMTIRLEIYGKQIDIIMHKSNISKLSLAVQWSEHSGLHAESEQPDQAHTAGTQPSTLSIISPQPSLLC